MPHHLLGLEYIASNYSIVGTELVNGQLFSGLQSTSFTFWTPDHDLED
jgi:hypothetical protein